jgi:hypothetical protein
MAKAKYSTLRETERPLCDLHAKREWNEVLSPSIGICRRNSRALTPGAASQFYGSAGGVQGSSRAGRVSCPPPIALRAFPRHLRVCLSISQRVTSESSDCERTCDIKFMALQASAKASYIPWVGVPFGDPWLEQMPNKFPKWWLRRGVSGKARRQGNPLERGGTLSSHQA